MNRIAKIFESLSAYTTTKALLSFRFEGYLKDSGWINSFEKQMPLDNSNQPLPWVTYPFIDFIKPRLRKSHNLFEYGCGNSTLFYSQHVNKVYALEHNKEWFSKIKKSIPVNATLIYQELKTDDLYCRYATTMKEKFDIIIIDGRDRINCCLNSISALGQEGTLILDDSERTEYKAGIDFMRKNGFKEIPFWGMAPGLKYKKCTSIFYQEKNCLGI